MAQDIVAACGNCGFFRPSPAAMKNTTIGARGECRRFPHAELKDESDWCGEHQPRAVKGKVR